MKKLFFITLLFILKTISVNAQEFNYGLMAGFSFVNLSFRDISKNTSCNVSSRSIGGYQINGFVSFKSDSWWEISLEPGFVMKGGHLALNYRKEPIYFGYMATKNYSNVELPILLNTYINSKFYFSTGFVFDFLAASETDDSMTSNGYVDWTSPKLPKMEKRFNSSAILGISYVLSDLLDIGAKYQIGLNSLMRVDLLGAIESTYQLPEVYSSIYSNCLQLSIKYKIN